MKCNRIQSRLSAFLDGELNEQDQKVVQQHLDGCTKCQAVFAQFQKVETLLHDGVQLKPDSFLLTRVKANVGENSLRARWIRVALQKTLVPIALVAGLLVGILMGVQLNSLSAPQHAAIEQRPEPTSTYSVIDPNIYEPMPSGSITATYVSASMSR
jgi:anti-sigma factor RsiW